jgi:PIN domain nuclease of toxin-antitoxin system
LPAGLDPVEAALDFGAQWIAIEPRHAHAAAMLGGLHGDPADRLLVATAREENLVFVTRDATILELAPRLLGPLLLEA